MANKSIERVDMDLFDDIIKKAKGKAAERVVFTSPLKKTINVRKDVKERIFNSFQGLKVTVGKEISLSNDKKGKMQVPITDEIAEKLSLSQGDTVCITEKEGGFLLKKIIFEEVTSQDPGVIVVDKFHQNQVVRQFANNSDLKSFQNFSTKPYLPKLPKLKYNPLTPFEKEKGHWGALVRRDILEKPAKDDAAFFKDSIESLIAAQEDNGSWEDDSTRTAFNLIRLVEYGCKKNHESIQRAADYLLSDPSIEGLPGLYFPTLALTERFNAWKQQKKSGRSFRNDTQKEKDVFLENIDLLPFLSRVTLCAIRITWSTAVVIEALARAGKSGHKRVQTALHTLLALKGSKNWCGCGYTDSRVSIKEGKGMPNLNVPFEQVNAAYAIDWFQDQKSISHFAVQDDSNRQAIRLDKNRAVLAKEYHSTGDCSLVVHRALSFLPEYKNSNLEKYGVLEAAYRQNELGDWGQAYSSSMMWVLERMNHPLADFMILKTIPHLVNTQKKNGMWEEEFDTRKGLPRPSPIQATFNIVQALHKKGLLKTLMPS